MIPHIVALETLRRLQEAQKKKKEDKDSVIYKKDTSTSAVRWIPVKGKGEIRTDF